MDEARFHEIASGRACDLTACLVRPALRAASWLYGTGVRGRLLGYRMGLLPSRRVNAPVICVGNLSTGGTGKTPFVALVCERLAALGRKPGVVSRGYRGGADGKNDEAKLLAELLPDVTLISNPDRFAGANAAIGKGANVIVLDDGFSHLKLSRNLDILLFDALRPFGYDALLPRGLLREPLSSARRAKLAVITRCDAVDEASVTSIEERLARLGFSRESIIRAEHSPVELAPVRGAADAGADNPYNPAWLYERPVAMLCGIGNPDGFKATLERLGARIVYKSVWPDHFAYDDEWLRTQWPGVVNAEGAAGAQAIIVTQKDAVKLRGRLTDAGAPDESALPVLALGVRMKLLGDGNERIVGALTTAVAASPKGRAPA